MSNETTDTPTFKLPDDLVQSIGALNEMCSQQEDSAAAILRDLNDEYIEEDGNL